MAKHLLFDLDGTLIDSSDSILASFAGALAHCGRQPTMALERSLIGPPLRETMRKIAGSDDAAELDRLVAAFKDDYDTRGYLKTQAFPGIAAALGALRAGGAALFIVTNKRILPTRRILTHFRWDSLFDGVYALDSTVPPATDKTALVAEVMKHRSIDPREAAFIGDTVEDMAAATRNGLHFAAATWGYGGFPAEALNGVTVLAKPDDLAGL